MQQKFKKGVKKMRNNLKKMLKEKGITGAELSRRTQIPAAAIYSICSGNMLAWPGWKQRISAALGVPEAVIFPSGEEDKNHGQ